MRSLGALPLALPLAAAVASADVEPVQECVEANMPRVSAVQKLAFESRHEGGEPRFEARVTLFWRRFADGERRILLRFTEPEDLDQTALLVETGRSGRPKIHIYLPGQGKPRRLRSRGQIEGLLGRANLGVTELELLLDPVGGRDLELVDESAILDGSTAWVLERRGEDDDRYSRTVAFIDRDLCIPVRAELYDHDRKRWKALEVDRGSIVRVVESWVPKLLVFHDLRENVETRIRVEEVEVDAGFSPALLTVEAMPRPMR